MKHLNKMVLRRYAVALLVSAVALGICIVPVMAIDQHEAWWDFENHVEFTLSSVPNAVGNYDHACVYVRGWAWWSDDKSWFSGTHTIQITKVIFSVNPNGQNIYFDVYCTSGWFLMDPQLVQNAQQVGDKWEWTPNPSTFQFSPYSFRFWYDFKDESVYAFEPRVWDNGSQTVYTYAVKFKQTS